MIYGSPDMRDMHRLLDLRHHGALLTFKGTLLFESSTLQLLMGIMEVRNNRRMPSDPVKRHLASQWRGDRLVRCWGSLGSETVSSDRSMSLIVWLKEIFSRTFLPEGYPTSVSNDYLGEIVTFNCNRVHHDGVCMH
jgi:hypothetical protein